MATSVGPQEARAMEETHIGGGNDQCQLPLGQRRLRGHDQCQLPLGHRRFGPQRRPAGGSVINVNLFWANIATVHRGGVAGEACGRRSVAGRCVAGETCGGGDP